MTELWVCLKSVRAFLRAFLAKKFGGYLKISYLCIVNEADEICGLTGRQKLPSARARVS